ncbi:glycosyltransferase family 39 protein [Streptomyces sp. NPDC006733]|uniref:glycosyltransferase family 39 protein n=1 Tax=Streptomyces sp. NPDC006733 TaxID=3155460 RepID=UPI0033E031D4
MVRPGRQPALVVACVFTAAAVVQQILLAVGVGGPLPGWQPLPFLLAAAPAWLLARPWATAGRRPPYVLSRIAVQLRRVPSWAPPAAVLATAAAVWAALQDQEPYLGHEEAVYADKARSWADGTPDAGWGTYRPIGLPVLGRIALGLSDTVGAVRAVALVLALFTLTVTYLVAARWTTPHRAAVAALLVLGGLGFLRRVPEFLNDIGSTGLLLIVVYLLTRAQEKPSSRALLWVPPFALAAFYLRYGVAGNLVAIAIAAVAAYGPRAWLAQRRRLAVAAAVFLAGLVPHFVYATKVAGWPLGLVFSATSHANRAYVGDGFVYYLGIFPYRLAGDLGAVVMAAGLYAAGAALRRRRSAGAEGGTARRKVFLGSTAVLVMLLLGVATDGEPRFVYLSVVLLTILGVQALADLTGRWSAQVLTAVALLAAVTVPATAMSVAHGAMPAPNAERESTIPVAERLSSDRPCLLVTGYEPEMGWYSGCDAITYAQAREAGFAAGTGVPAGTEVSFVLFRHGRLQPGAAALRELIAGRPTTTRTIRTTGSLGTATVVTLR